MKEIILPAHAVAESGQFPFTVGRVNRQQVEVPHIQHNDPAFMVMLLHAHAVGHLQRLLLGEDGRAGIAFLFRIVPVLMIAWQIQFHLPRLHLCLLQAEYIRIQRAEAFHKALTHGRANTVDVPGNQLHCSVPLQQKSDSALPSDSL